MYVDKNFESLIRGLVSSIHPAMIRLEEILDKVRELQAKRKRALSIASKKRNEIQPECWQARIEAAIDDPSILTVQREFREACITFVSHQLSWAVANEQLGALSSELVKATREVLNYHHELVPQTILDRDRETTKVRSSLEAMVIQARLLEADDQSIYNVDENAEQDAESSLYIDFGQRKLLNTVLHACFQELIATVSAFVPSIEKPYFSDYACPTSNGLYNQFKELRSVILVDASTLNDELLEAAAVFPSELEKVDSAIETINELVKIFFADEGYRWAHENGTAKDESEYCSELLEVLIKLEKEPGSQGDRIRNRPENLRRRIEVQKRKRLQRLAISIAIRKAEATVYDAAQLFKKVIAEFESSTKWLDKNGRLSIGQMVAINNCLAFDLKLITAMGRISHVRTRLAGQKVDYQETFDLTEPFQQFCKRIEYGLHRSSNPF